MSPILVQATFIFAYAILAEAGAVVPRRRRAARDADLGHDGRRQPAVRAPGVLARAVPGLAIILTALSLQMLGDGLRDLLDPKLRKAL